MAYGDPVLQRPMFQTSPGLTPSVGGSTPEDNARALRNMFAPTVPIDMPAQMIQQEQQPVQSFQTGGEAITPAEAARRQSIDDADTLRAPAAPTSQFYRDIEPFLPNMPTEGRVMENAAALRRLTEARRNALEQQQRVLEEYRAGSPGSSVGDYFRAMPPEERTARAAARTAAAERVLREGPVIGQTFAREAGVASLLPAPPAPPAAAPSPAPSGGAFSMADIGVGGGEIYSADPSRALMSQAGTRMVDAGARPAAPAQARPKGALELTLEGIRAERARSAEDKRQNALLALMQAGFAAAAGRSPNALSNIAAGGQAGVGAFAAMEKDRRADLASLRREETAILLERERMRAQEERQPEAIRTYAALGGWDPARGREGFDEAVRRGIEVTKSLEREPDMVRLMKALGGGDLARGFRLYNADEALKAATKTLDSFSASEQDKRQAQDLINARVSQSLQAIRGNTPGGGSFPGFSATPVR